MIELRTITKEELLKEKEIAKNTVSFNIDIYVDENWNIISNGRIIGTITPEDIAAAYTLQVTPCS